MLKGPPYKGGNQEVDLERRLFSVLKGGSLGFVKEVKIFPPFCEGSFPAKFLPFVRGG